MYFIELRVNLVVQGVHAFNVPTYWGSDGEHAQRGQPPTHQLKPLSRLDALYHSGELDLNLDLVSHSSLGERERTDTLYINVEIISTCSSWHSNLLEV